MKTVSVKMPERILKAIDELVEKGAYRSRSEAVRAAVAELLRSELWKLGASLLAEDPSAARRLRRAW